MQFIAFSTKQMSHEVKIRKRKEKKKKKKNAIYLKTNINNWLLVTLEKKIYISSLETLTEYL